MSSSSAPDLACDLAERFEGYHKALPNGDCTTYVCPAGVLTIGWGSTGDIKPGDVWARQQADAALRKDMRASTVAAIALCPVLATQPPGRQAAIGDFVYNLGRGRLKASTLRKRINAGQWDQVPAELRKWVMGGGRKLPGLMARREAEIALI